jgi:hypothetical protein
MPKTTYEDPVVAEIHAIRAKMLAECDGDHKRLMEETRRRQEASGREVITAPPAPTSPKPAVQPSNE